MWYTNQHCKLDVYKPISLEIHHYLSTIYGNNVVHIINDP